MRKLRDLGERRLLEWIIRRLDECEGASLPPGDDAADMIFEGRLIVSCDMLVESTDIPRGMNLRDVGFKAITSATSDIAAKGGKPIAYLISLALPAEMPVAAFQELWEGFKEAADLYGGRIIGGDLNSGSEVIIDVTCFGKADRTMSRLGARPGDVLAVTGEFGSQAAGLHALLNNLRGEQTSEEVIKSFLRPIARVKEALELAKSEAVTSSIDSSDGLAESLLELSRLNDVGFVIDHPPISSYARRYSEKFHIDLFDLVFYGGEEYELVLTLKPRLIDRAVEAVERSGGKLMIIGETVEEKSIKVRWLEGWRVLEKRGYQHFRF